MLQTLKELSISNPKEIFSFLFEDDNNFKPQIIYHYFSLLEKEIPFTINKNNITNKYSTIQSLYKGRDFLSLKINNNKARINKNYFIARINSAKVNNIDVSCKFDFNTFYVDGLNNCTLDVNFMYIDKKYQSGHLYYLNCLKKEILSKCEIK